MAGISTPQQAFELAGRNAISGTGRGRGALLYNWIVENRPEQVLELGFAHGFAAAHMGAALEHNGIGHLTSVDNLSAYERSPSAQDLIERAGLDHRVTLVYEQTSYHWFLNRTLRGQLVDGEIVPLYDFCFLDGAHTWSVDGFAFYLVNALLKPGGTILFDDLGWTPTDPEDPQDAAVPGVGEVWDLLVSTHPEYGELVTDGNWGWAKKTRPADGVRTLVQRDVFGSARDVVRTARANDAHR